MANSSPNPSTADLVDGTLAVAAGVGIVTLGALPSGDPDLVLRDAMHDLERSNCAASICSGGGSRDA